MSYKDFNKEYESLPDDLKQEMEDFVAHLKVKSQKEQPEKMVHEKPVAGLAKGKINIIISDDFDEPLEDFKDYM